MLTATSPLSEWITILDGKGACAEAIVWLNSLGSITIGEGMDIMLADDACLPSWCMWAWNNSRNDVEREISQKFLIKIVEHDEGSALHAYINTSDLTPFEKQFLWEGFQNKLPTAAEEIANGVITIASA